VLLPSTYRQYTGNILKIKINIPIILIKNYLPQKNEVQHGYIVVHATQPQQRTMIRELKMKSLAYFNHILTFESFAIYA
jgi:hypothetical protein